MANFCSNCGAATAADIRFCASCGVKTGPGIDPQSPIVAPATFSPRANVFPTRHGLGTALPAPPSLHWAVVLILSILTLGIFFMIWWGVQAFWVKRLTGCIRPLIWFCFACLFHILLMINPISSVIPFAVFAFGWFSLKKYVVLHYRSVEPINLEIDSWKTLLGNIFYLQARFGQIAEMKRAQPQYFAPYCTPVVYQPQAMVYQPTR